MAITHSFTATLPAPSATISDGFVFLLTTAWFTNADQGAAGSPIDGGANSIANGGGDMMAFSDTLCTTRLPIHVITFVAGVSPDAFVRIRTPTYETGDTITIGLDDTQTTQPLVTAPYGRNAVYQNDGFRFDFKTTTDISGNGYDLTLDAGTTVGNVDATRGYYLDTITNSGAKSTTGTSSFGTADAVSMSMWIERASNSYTVDFQEALAQWTNNAENDTFQTYISNAAGALDNKPFVATSGGNTTGDTGGSTIPLSTWVMLHFVFDQPNNTVKIYEDGALTLTVTGYTDNSIADTTLVIAKRFSDNTDGLIGKMANLGSHLYAVDDARASSEYLNQSAPDTFATIGEYAVFGGGPGAIITPFYFTNLLAS